MVCVEHPGARQVGVESSSLRERKGEMGEGRRKEGEKEGTRKEGMRERRRERREGEMEEGKRGGRERGKKGGRGGRERGKEGRRGGRERGKKGGRGERERRKRKEGRKNEKRMHMYSTCKQQRQSYTGVKKTVASHTHASYIISVHVCSVIETRHRTLKDNSSSFPKRKRRAASGGIRTRDVLRARQMLYQLSHRGSSAGQAESLQCV